MEEKKDTINGIALALTFLIASIITFSLKSTFNHQWILMIILVFFGGISLLGIFSEMNNAIKENRITGVGNIIIGLILTVLVIMGIKNITYDIIKICLVLVMLLTIYLTFDGMLSLINSMSNKSVKIKEKYKIKDVLLVITKFITVILSVLQIFQIVKIIK
ncbi:hypothetical protein DVV81_10125 [Clostridium botulinum]|uniref:hypothetical protein n=1 Tax=Clostridium botulinum TaxID=1491 RepID=UPI001966F93E|nr:hypothetical protein [Clostridium botulinum]MBN1071520.1 hypothetical protein [Clostridium botulinum]